MSFKTTSVASKKTRPISPFMWGGFKPQIGKAKKFEQILTGNCRKNLEVPPINEEVGRVHLSKGGNLITLLGTDGPTKTDEFSEGLGGGGDHFQSKNLYCKIWTFK